MAMTGRFSIRTAVCLLAVATQIASASLHASFWTEHPDRVKILPGYTPGAPPTTILSGYLHYEFHGEQIHTHYMLFKAEEAFFDDDDEPPLIYWSNGGPGASSTVGLWTELGPVLLNDDAKTDAGISPQYNPYSWTRLGHLLMIDQPAPVGFSYCNEDIDSENCGAISWTDELTTKNAMKAFESFFGMFPTFLDVPLYLTGESYAGIYIPSLAREAMKVYDNLVGFAVGDGCLGTETGICSMIGEDYVPGYWDLLFLLGHHQIPIDTYHAVMSACRTNWSSEESTPVHFPNTPACRDAWEKVNAKIGGLYEYGLYDECTYENGLLKGGTNDYPCGGDIVMQEYFGLPEVQKAFHVKPNFFQTDNAEGDFKYTPTEPDLRPFYKEINGKLRVLVYNGDADPAINSFMARDWTSRMGFTEVEAWRPWTVDGCRRMGGYVTRYEGDFEFLTIRGAGHMVPTIKPAAALAFIGAWIRDNEYPIYDADCAEPNPSSELHRKRLIPNSLAKDA